MTKTTAKTKNGKTVGVLVLDVSEVSASSERRAYEAADLARANDCAHWRITKNGAVVQLGSAAAPVRTHEQAAAVSGPENERHDW